METVQGGVGISWNKKNSKSLPDLRQPLLFRTILDSRNQRYKVRSTKETNRVEARKVADEYAHQITSRDAPADREFSFKTYANRFVQKGRQLAE